MTCIPSRLTAGDSWSLDLGASEYPAPQWAVALLLIAEAPGSAPVSLAGTWDGSTWTATAAPATTATLPPGFHAWRLIATDAAAPARATIGSGRLELLADPATGGDLRSTARRNLDAIDAALADPSWLGAESYTIEGRSLARRTRDDLMALRAIWAAAVRAEEGRGLFVAITPRLAR